MPYGNVDLFSGGSSLLYLINQSRQREKLEAGLDANGQPKNLNYFRSTNFSSTQDNPQSTARETKKPKYYLDYAVYGSFKEQPNRLNQDSATIFEEWFFAGADDSTATLTDIITVGSGDDGFNSIDVETIWVVATLGADSVDNSKFIAVDRDEVYSVETGTSFSCVKTSSFIIVSQSAGCQLTGYQQGGGGLVSCDNRCSGLYALFTGCVNNPEGTTGACVEEFRGFPTGVRSYHRRAKPVITSSEAKAQSWHMVKTDGSPSSIDDGPAKDSLPLEDLTDGCTVEADISVCSKGGSLWIYWAAESEYNGEDLIFGSDELEDPSVIKTVGIQSIPAGRHYVSITVKESLAYVHIDGVLTTVSAHDGWSTTEQNVVAVTGSLFPQVTKDEVEWSELRDAIVYAVKLTAFPLYDETDYIPGTL